MSFLPLCAQVQEQPPAPPGTILESMDNWTLDNDSNIAIASAKGNGYGRLDITFLLSSTLTKSLWPCPLSNTDHQHHQEPPYESTDIDIHMSLAIDILETDLEFKQFFLQHCAHLQEPPGTILGAMDIDIGRAATIDNTRTALARIDVDMNLTRMSTSTDPLKTLENHQQPCSLCLICVSKQPSL